MKHLSTFRVSLLFASCLAFILAGFTVDARLSRESQEPPEVLSAATDLYLFSQKLLVASPSPIGQDNFGTSVAISGDRAVVGAPLFDIGGSNDDRGAVYIYKRIGDEWQLVERLVGEAAGDRFGESVGISGTTIVVGAIYYGSNDRGAAYVFTESCSPTCTWNQQTRLEDTADYTGDDLSSDYFGRSVAIDGDRIIVGAYFDRTDPSHVYESGSATIFTRSGTTWSVAQKLAGPGAGSDGRTQFGWSVDIAGDQAIVGGNTYSSTSPTPTVLGRGLAFIYELNSGAWINTKGFVGPSANSELGHSVAIDSGTAVVGAPGNAQGAPQAAYTSSKTCPGGTWCDLVALTPNGGNQIGTSVDIDGDKIVVGVHIGNARGEVLIFRKISGTWTHKGTVATAQTTSADFLGSDVGVDENRIIAGANVDTGTASLFSVNPAVRFDYDGRFSASTPRFDNYGICGAEVGVFRPSDNIWYIDQQYCGPPINPSPTPTPQLVAHQWGTTGDKLTPADFNGDGRMDIAIFRPSDSTDWYIRDSATGSASYINYGVVGDIPVPSDFDGDGSADPAVFRPSEGKWYVSKSTGGTIVVQFGTAGDLPGPRDLDGDGISELVVFRPSDTTYYAYNLVSQQVSYPTLETECEDILVAGDFDGDLKSDMGLFRPKEGKWYVRYSTTGSVVETEFGEEGDIPAPADYDSDGETDIAVFRPDEGWYILLSRSGDFRYRSFGTSGDIPVAAAYNASFACQR